MDKVSNTQKGLILLAFLIVGGFIGYYWDNISQLWSSPANNANVGRRMASTNVFPSTGKSMGCSCINGTISNYGLGSNVPCSQWSRYCTGSIS